jgi:DNA polymerase-3 subunit beta
MKISCQRDSLLTAFLTAAAVAPVRSPKAIIKNVKLDVAGSALVLTATDMEVGIRIEVPDVEVESEGQAVVPVSQFGGMLRESTDERLSIEADPQGTLVRGQRSELRLTAENPDEFPAVPSFDGTSFHEVPARLFREMVRRTAFATDAESSRYALGGILLEMEPTQITAVATDGRRLAKMVGPAQAIDEHQTGEAMTIVPARAMQLIERAITDGDAEIKVAARANDVVVASPRVTITARLVEGRFPKWREVFPSRTESVQIELAAGPLHGALRQAAIVTSEESRGIDFSFGNGSLVMSGSTAEIGQSRVEIPISYDGADAITITLDHRFVLDFLKVLDPEKTVTVDVESGDAAALFSTDDGYGYVVMPLARDG